MKAGTRLALGFTGLTAIGVAAGGRARFHAIKASGFGEALGQVCAIVVGFGLVIAAVVVIARWRSKTAGNVKRLAGRNCASPEEPSEEIGQVSEAVAELDKVMRRAAAETGGSAAELATEAERVAAAAHELVVLVQERAVRGNEAGSIESQGGSLGSSEGSAW